MLFILIATVLGPSTKFSVPRSLFIYILFNVGHYGREYLCTHHESHGHKSSIIIGGGRSFRGPGYSAF